MSETQIRNESGVPRSSSSDSKQARVAKAAIKSTLLLALALGLGGWGRSAFATERVWSKQFHLAPGGHVSVVNAQGSVLIEGWDRAEVEATVAMRSKSPTDQLNDVQVAAEAHDGVVEFHTLYPKGLDSPIRVDYRLRVPREVHLDQVSTLQGDIVIHQIDGSLEAHNLNGDIAAVDVSGPVSARALTGNIMISLRRAPDANAPLEIATINGNVDLALPSQSNANFDFSTVAGNIASPYPFQVSATPGDSTRHAQAGAGGARIELKTVRGNIRVSHRDREL